MKKLIFIGVSFFFLLGFFFGCYPTSSFYSNFHSKILHSEVAVTDEKICSSELQQNFYENKILFVVDKTSSSKESDTTQLRSTNIREFIERYQHLHFSYGFIYFRDGKSQSLFSEEENPIFTKDKILIEEKLNEFEGISDKGKENYDSIMSSIENILNHDQKKNSSKIIEYHVFYISDGSEYESQEEGEVRFLNGIQRLLQKWNQMTFHGVYYGNYKNRKKSFSQKMGKFSGRLVSGVISYNLGIPVALRGLGSSPDPEEESITDDVLFLKNVSQQGRGKYINLNVTGLKLDSKATQLWSLERLFVYNLNSAICFDGYMGADSDSDGLCDIDEESMEGFFPDKKFSFEDGYSDYFHWLALSRESYLPPCHDRRDDDQDLLTVCEEKYLNFLFENEEGMISLKGNNPDSDGDTIVDGIEAFVYLSVYPQASLDPHNLFEVRISGEENDLNKLLKHTSPFVSSKTQGSFGVRMIPISDKDRSCYGIQNGSFPIHPTLSFQDLDSRFNHEKDESILFIYALQKKEDSENLVYQFGFTRVNQNRQNLSLPELKPKMF